MQNELERYKNFDPTNAPLVKPSFVKITGTSCHSSSKGF